MTEEGEIEKKKARPKQLQMGSKEFREAVKDVQSATALKKAYKEGAELVSEEEYQEMARQAIARKKKGLPTSDIWGGKQKTAPIKLKTKELEERVYGMKEQLPFGKPYGKKDQPWKEGEEIPPEYDISQQQTTPTEKRSCDPADILKVYNDIPKTIKENSGYNALVKDAKEKTDYTTKIKDARKDFFKEVVTQCGKDGIGIKVPITPTKTPSAQKGTGTGVGRGGGLAGYQCYMKWCKSEDVLIPDKSKCKSPEAKEVFYDEHKTEWKQHAEKGCQLDDVSFVLPKVESK